MAFVAWITGLSGAGKTTVASEVYSILKKKVNSLVLLDGDDFREILGSNTGHASEDRLLNARRLSNMCKYFVKYDINVICATMSLFREIHEFNRSQIENYLEIYLKTSMDELHQRDSKNIYKNFLQGKLENVVGMDIVFDEPQKADLVLDNGSLEHLKINIKKIVNIIENRFLLNIENKVKIKVKEA